MSLHTIQCCCEIPLMAARMEIFAQARVCMIASEVFVDAVDLKSEAQFFFLCGWAGGWMGGGTCHYAL